ncbi:MAG: mannose-1-phosphate guanylyltransferase/mannose-6-phosphate isomerase [Rhabdochlamydiaceae bacterium]
MKIIILAGGSGTRLWPYSRSCFPKQFLHFGDQRSLLQKTIERFVGRYPFSDFLIVTNQAYYHLVKTQACEIAPELEKQILIEPERRNTAPAIALGLSYLQKEGNLSSDECVLVCSSDHLISPAERFLDAIEKGESYAKKGSHVIFGIRPHKPETGYGYIKATHSLTDHVYEVEEFIEKPSLEMAEQYLLDGHYLWNSGIFLFHIETFIDEMKDHCPLIAEKLQTSFEHCLAGFADMPDISIDYALMEKSKKSVVISLDATWSDIGSWDSVYEIFEKDENQNVKIGNVLDIDTNNCLIMGGGKRLISTIGVKDLLVIETEDALFIGKKGESQRVKALVEELKKRNAKEPFENLTSHRPWGKFTILEEGNRYKIKRIVVDPGQRLSLQMHYHRSEHWIVVKGTAKVTIGDKEMLVHENESIFVPKSEMHRLENPGMIGLELIEVQVGEYVGEEDIVRFDDIYGRQTSKASLQ